MKYFAAGHTGEAWLLPFLYWMMKGVSDLIMPVQYYITGWVVYSRTRWPLVRVKTDCYRVIDPQKCSLQNENVFFCKLNVFTLEYCFLCVYFILFYLFFVE